MNNDHPAVVIFDNVIATLEAAQAKASASDYVLAWSGGLGVGGLNSDKPYVCGIVAADSVTDFDRLNNRLPIIRNGNGAEARITRRIDAIRDALSEAVAARNDIAERY